MLKVKFYFNNKLIDLPKKEKIILKVKSLDNVLKKNVHSSLKWEIYETKALLSLRLHTCNTLQSKKKGGVFSLWHIYVGERRTIFANAYEIIFKKEVLLGSC
jgi:hypothetical protein